MKEIYDLLETILFTAMDQMLDSDRGFDYELIQFLNVNDTPYEILFYQYNETYDLATRAKYKLIMKKMMLGISYKISIYNNDAGHPNEAHLSIFSDYSNEDLLSFFDVDLESMLDDDFSAVDFLTQVFDDVLSYSQENYLYQDECLRNLLGRNELKVLKSINPMETLKLISLPSPLPSEETIFICLENISSVVATIIENEEEVSELIVEDHIIFNFGDCTVETTPVQLKSLMDDALNDYFDGDLEAIEKLYSYVIGNVYENLKGTIINEDSLALLTYLEDSMITLEEVMTRYETEPDFFTAILVLFSGFNLDLCRDDLQEKRDILCRMGATDTLQKFNPYYQVEQKTFYGASKMR